MSRKAGTPNKPKVTSHPMGELDTVDEPREVATKYENPIDQRQHDIPVFYWIVSSTDIKDLMYTVDVQMTAGALPQGGVSVTNYRALDGSITMVYCQAMVKREG